MPKLDLTRAIQIKGAGGNIAKLKGSGFLWEAPYLAGGEHPDLIADFERERYLHSGEVQAAFSDLATFARASGATYTDATGTIQTVASNVPRIGHHVWNGSTWVNQGLLLESEARTNLLHETDEMPTQTEAVTAQPYTLHFTGTGTITLSGASTAGPLVGTGDGEENRVSLTFTPSAGTLTLTVSGTVTNAQLEAGSTPSSYIPNLAASGSVTRAAETLTIDNPPWPATVEATGTELVTNGTFDTDVSGWSAGGSAALSQSNGELIVTSTTAFGRAEQNVGVLSAGSVYELTVDFISTTGASGKADIKIVNSLGAFSVAGGASVGTHRILFPGSSSYNTVSIGDNGDASAVTVFDNISVKEINPLAVSIAMDGLMTYADTGASVTSTLYQLRIDSTTQIRAYIDTWSTLAGRVVFQQTAGGVDDFAAAATDSYSPGINVPFSIASRHGDNFINGAVDGTALTADTTPVALPDLSATDLQLGYDFMGTIKTFRMWGADIGDTGISGASS